MELNRNQWLTIGFVLGFLGVQLRRVESVQLTEKASRFLAERLPTAANTNDSYSLGGITPRRVIRPPDWLGFALLSIGGVLILHSLAMKKPGG